VCKDLAAVAMNSIQPKDHVAVIGELGWYEDIAEDKKTPAQLVLFATGLTAVRRDSPKPSLAASTQDPES
jgi:hypothetical protein